MSETTPALVAEQATLPDILPLDGVTLIGIFNAYDGPAALLRSSRGKIERVTPGAQAMGMTVTACYIFLAVVLAPALVQAGLNELAVHLFILYWGMVSFITPPVALASYAAAGISGANPMETSVASFKIGIAAFIVPFMFFYNSALLMDGTTFEILRAGATAIVGVFFLSSGVQGWFVGARSAWFIRGLLIVAALFLISGGLLTDLIGVGLAVVTWLVQRLFHPNPDAPIPVRGAD